MSGFWEVRDLKEIIAICNHLQGHCRRCKISTTAIVGFYISIGSPAIYLRTRPSGERTVMRSSFFPLKYTFDWQLKVYTTVICNCLKFNDSYDVKGEDDVFGFFFSLSLMPMVPLISITYQKIIRFTYKNVHYVFDLKMTLNFYLWKTYGDNLCVLLQLLFLFPSSESSKPGPHTCSASNLL